MHEVLQNLTRQREGARKTEPKSSLCDSLTDTEAKMSLVKISTALYFSMKVR